MKLNLLLLLLIFSSPLFSQDFNLLYDDAQGDPSVNGIADIKSVSYAIDEAADSIWFKVEFYNSIAGDLGIVYGIDTDLTPGNGLEWNSSNNSSLKPEVVFTVNRNFIAPETIYGFSNITLDYTSYEGETDSVMITNLTLSQLDEDGKFNFVLGTSGFDADVNNRTIFDDAPESTFLTVDVTTSVEDINGLMDTPKFYPNPGRNQVELTQLPNSLQLICYDQWGREWQKLSISTTTFTLDTSSWPEGMYYFKIISDGQSNVESWIKQ